MKRRVFVAIPISEPLQEEILNWENECQKRGACPAPFNRKGGVRWLAGKNLHLTLVPPWYEETIEDVVSRMQNVGDGLRSFDVTFKRVTYGPNPKRPRLIWAGGETPRQLLELKESVEKTLGVEPEKRPYRLHLTIARFRPENFSQFSIKQLDEKVRWEERVENFVLMESHLSRGGADYEVLKEFLLR